MVAFAPHLSAKTPARSPGSGWAGSTGGAAIECDTSIRNDPAKMSFMLDRAGSFDRGSASGAVTSLGEATYRMSRKFPRCCKLCRDPIGNDARNRLPALQSLHARRLLRGSIYKCGGVLLWKELGSGNLMKRSLQRWLSFALFCWWAFVLVSKANASPILGQVDNFQGSTQNWQNGHDSSADTIAPNGPSGPGDDFLEIQSGGARIRRSC